MPVHKVRLNVEGTHLLDEDLSFLRWGAGSYKEATGVVDAPIPLQ